MIGLPFAQAYPIRSAMTDKRVIVQCSPYCQMFHASFRMIMGVSHVAVDLQRLLATVSLGVRPKCNIGPLGAIFTFSEGVWLQIPVLSLMCMRAGILRSRAD